LDVEDARTQGEKLTCHAVVRSSAADDNTFGWLMAVPTHVDRILNEVLLGES
jgi:hypothetical protein